MNDSSQKNAGLPADSEPGVVHYRMEAMRQERLNAGISLFEFDSASRSAPIIEPNEGAEITGRFVAQKVLHRGAHYMIIDTGEREVAAKVSVAINAKFINPPLIRLDGVAVERHNRPIETAWLLFSSLDGKLWLPSNQQIREFVEYRTEPASRWVAEIETLLPVWRAERKVINDRSLESGLDEALKKAPELIERLRPLGHTPVMMERFTIRRFPRSQLPMPTGELPPAQKANQLSRRRMKM
jgi:hypothetical protein